jgi:hypothetical protein
MYRISGRYEFGIPQADLWGTSTNMGGELTVYFKNTSTTIHGFCMVRYYIPQVFGGVLDFVQLDFRNNGLSVNNAIYIYICEPHPSKRLSYVPTTTSVTLDEIRCSSARRVRKPRLAFQQT